MSGAGFDESIWVGVVSVLLLTVVSFMVILVRMMVIGQGSGMSPDRFVLYGIPDGRLQTGIYLASLAGPASVFGLVCLLAVVPLYRSRGAGPMLAAVLGAVLGLAVLLALSRVSMDLVTTLVASKRAKCGFYLIALRSPS